MNVWPTHPSVHEIFTWVWLNGLRHVVGSAYCIRDYHVDAHLGGDEGLVIARAALAQRSVRLILDLVPNHVAPDHPWVDSNPEFFVQGTADDLERDPDGFLQVGARVLACGRDPYFPAWPEVLQLDASRPGLYVALEASHVHLLQCGRMTVGG